MKKIIVLLLSIFMALSLVACSNTDDGGNTTPEVTKETYKLGMGVVTKTDSSKDGQAQVDATVATVVTDADGKIVACTIDVAQSKLVITDGTVDPTTTFKTKMELGDDYNMVKYAEDCDTEWYDQAKAFAEYSIGKTGAEVASTALRTRGEDEPHAGYVVVADEELFASCSISVSDFMEAIEKACNDDQAKTFEAEAGSFKLGVAAYTTADESTDATDEKDGEAKIYTTFAASVIDGEGKLLAGIIDAIQPRVAFDTESAITGATFVATKRELKEDYNMVKYAEDCDIEWYQQSANFTDYCVGKTSTEIAGLETRVRGEDEPHTGYVVAADEELFASCSITLTDLKATLAQASDYAANPLH